MQLISNAVVSCLSPVKNELEELRSVLIGHNGSFMLCVFLCFFLLPPAMSFFFSHHDAGRNDDRGDGNCDVTTQYVYRCHQCKRLWRQFGGLLETPLSVANRRCSPCLLPWSITYFINWLEIASSCRKLLILCCGSPSFFRFNTYDVFSRTSTYLL